MLQDWTWTLGVLWSLRKVNGCTSCWALALAGLDVDSPLHAGGVRLCGEFLYLFVFSMPRGRLTSEAGPMFPGHILLEACEARPCKASPHGVVWRSMT